MIDGKLKDSQGSIQCSAHILFSLAQEMTKKARDLNITYHPILDNFEEFDDVPRTEFNESLKFSFASSLTTGKQMPP